MTYNLERRQSPRKRFEHLLYVELEPGNGGMVLNFSEHGFGFRSVKRVRPQQEVKFAFNLSDRRRLEGRGRLEWADKEGRVAGVQFTSVSDEFRAEMRGWLATAADYESKPTEELEADSAAPEISRTTVEYQNRVNDMRRRDAIARAMAGKPGRSKPVMAPQTVEASETPASEAPSSTPLPSTAAYAQQTFLAEPPGVDSPAVDAEPTPHAAPNGDSPTITSPLTESTNTESPKSESPSAGAAVELPWAATLPPAIGTDRRPSPSPPADSTPDTGRAPAAASEASAEDSDQSEATEISDETQHDETLAEESDQPQAQALAAAPVMSSDIHEGIASVEARTASALNDHALALLHHFQREEQRVAAGFRESVARVLRESERKLFPIREAALAQMKSLESAVASAAASTKVLDKYPALLERAQQQALDRFQTQMQEMLQAHVMEMRRRSDIVLQEINAHPQAAGLLPRRIRTSSGIIVTAIIVMVLAIMFTFRREVAGAFIWLGQQMVEPTSASSPAPTNTSAPANNAAPANKPVTSEAKPTDQPQPASAAPGAIYTGPTDINSAPKTVAKEPVTETPPSPKKDVHALWADIAKGDIGAEMTLGNMYFTGHGVTRNCFQAHRLFAAAARKGNAEAKERLAQMENGACPL